MPTISAPGIDELTLPNHPETKVWLKRRATWGDRNRVQTAGLVAQREVAPGKKSVDPDGFADFVVIKTMVMIHDWTVTDESGKRALISAEALEALDPEDGEFIANEAGRRYNGNTAPLASNSEPTSATDSNSQTHGLSASHDSGNSFSGSRTGRPVRSKPKTPRP